MTLGPGPGPGRGPDPAPAEEDDAGPVGIFPSWKALYTTVVVYALGLIVLFWILSEALAFGTP